LIVPVVGEGLQQAFLVKVRFDKGIGHRVGGLAYVRVGEAPGQDRPRTDAVV
jgi:hypothetical protein